MTNQQALALHSEDEVTVKNTKAVTTVIQWRWPQESGEFIHQRNVVLSFSYDRKPLYGFVALEYIF